MNQILPNLTHLTNFVKTVKSVERPATLLGASISLKNPKLNQPRPKNGVGPTEPERVR